MTPKARDSIPQSKALWARDHECRELWGSGGIGSAHHSQGCCCLLGWQKNTCRDCLALLRKSMIRFQLIIFINTDPFDSKDRSQIPAKVLLLPKGCIIEEASKTTCILSTALDASDIWEPVLGDIETGVPKICHQVTDLWHEIDSHHVNLSRICHDFASHYVRPINCSLWATQGTWDDHLPLFKKEIIS